MRTTAYLVVFSSLILMATGVTSAASSRQPHCAADFASLVPAAPLAINEAKQLTVAAWSTTTRFLRKYEIEENEKNRDQILKIFDEALSHAMTPTGSARKFRGENGFRVVDAPQLETLRDQGVPNYVVKHLTVDHHSSFGVGLSLNVNSTTQILDLLDPLNSNFVAPEKFHRAFQKFASDNVGDAFGLARAVVRNSAAIRANPALRERLRQIAIAEDFGIFGPGLNINASDTIPALLRMNDRMLTSIGPDRTFMDRVNLGFGQKTADTIDQAGKDYDRILFSNRRVDQKFTKKLAAEFRASVAAGMAEAEKLKVPLATKTGQTAPIFFADTTTLGSNATPFFQSRLVIPQLIRKIESAGGARIERNFNIMGDARAATRTVICANLPDRGTSMMAPLAGQSKSFVDAFVGAEKSALAARMPSLRQMGGDALKQAEERQAQIEQGKWLPQNLPNGNLIFGSTYMNAAEFKNFLEQNLELLGYR